MGALAIRLPNGRRVSLAAYVFAWRRLKSEAPSAIVRGFFDWPASAADTLAAFRSGRPAGGAYQAAPLFRRSPPRLPAISGPVYFGGPFAYFGAAAPYFGAILARLYFGARGLFRYGEKISARGLARAFG